MWKIMNKVQFVIQDGIFGEEEQSKLVSSLNRNSVTYTIGIPNEVETDSSYFVRGSTAFLKNCSRKCSVICNDITRYEYHKYSRHINKLLNSNYLMLPWHQLCESGDMLARALNSDRFFIRPNSGQKLFTGTTLWLKHWELELSIIEKIPGTLIMPSDIVVVSDYKRIGPEYRAFMYMNRLIDVSPYGDDQDITEIDRLSHIRSIEEYVSRMRYTHDLFYVMDFTMTQGGPKVVELNSAPCAGWYDMDCDKIIKAILMGTYNA
jgi:hypothetical protein